MKFEFTARKRGDGEEYFPIKEHGLMVGIQEKGGNGTPDNPMSSTVMDEMLYYIRHRRDAYIESRLKDVIGWSVAGSISHRMRISFTILVLELSKVRNILLNKIILI